MNVRGKTGTSGTIRGSLGESDVAQIVDGPNFDTAGNAWYQVTVGDLTGYAREDFLAASSATATSQAQPAAAAARRLNSSIRLRASR